jgi:RimJ/RimL family protein N-acetyltransferase
MIEPGVATIPTVRAAGAIRIRKYRNDDIAQLLAAVHESVATVGRWQGWCQPGYADADGAGWIGYAIAAWDAGESHEFAIVDAANDAYLGGIGVNQRNREHNFANVGYWVRESYQSRGVATQAARLAIGFAFDVLRLTRVEIIAAVDNLPSRRVAEKVGATLEGIARNRLSTPRGLVDGAVYAVIPARESPVRG